jgi:hypothetical protein
VDVADHGVHISYPSRAVLAADCLYLAREQREVDAVERSVEWSVDAKTRDGLAGAT